MDDHLETGGQHGGKRPGTKLISSLSSIMSDQDYHFLQSKKPRGLKSMRKLQTLQDGQSAGEVSVKSAPSELSIDDAMTGSGHQLHPKGLNSPDISLAISKTSSIAAMRKSKIESSNALILFQSDDRSLVAPKTPQYSTLKAEALPATPATPSKPQRKSPQKTHFLTKGSNVTALTAWDGDVHGRLDNVEALFSELKQSLEGSSMERSQLEEALGIYQTRRKYSIAHVIIRALFVFWVLKLFQCTVHELDKSQARLEGQNSTLQADLDSTRQRLQTATTSLDEEHRILDDERRAHRIAIDDLNRDHRLKTDETRRQLIEEHYREVAQIQQKLQEKYEQLIKAHHEELRDLERRSEKNIEEERRSRLTEVQEIKAQIALEQQNLGLAVGTKDREIQNMQFQLDDTRGELDRERVLKINLQKTLTESSTTITSLESTVRGLRAHVEFLESDSKAQSDSFVSLERQLQEALKSAGESKAKLIKEETLRRILFNQVQELKGNIRVMCRVRPSSDADLKDGTAKFTYPDIEKEGRELEIIGPEEKSSLGTVTRKTNNFSFDKVFGPTSQNEEVFGEISQLVQSALDGYNVCIFCYGQTGSGKTYTMSSTDGMIPRATHQIYGQATSLKEKGWSYTIEGSFVEVYNEELHDLLGNAKDSDKKKLEIRHDEQRKQTTIVGLKSVPLESPEVVESILKQAATNRSVAATKANERSSRSHSVFILKLVGRNSTTNESSEGTLNLVDLAGSERLKQSGAEGDRMKETQNINKSLSCLGDVIGALGQNKEGAHIPYRNSKVCCYY